MNTIDKDINKLFEINNGIEAYKIINLLKERIDNKNRKIILNTLKKYMYDGKIEYIKDFVLEDILESVKINETGFSSFFKDYIEYDYSERAYLGIKGYLKTSGEDSYEFLARMVLDDKVSVRIKGVIIRELAKHSNNSFEKGIPKDLSLIKDNNINYIEFEDWIFSGYDKGNGYETPIRDISLDNPKNEEEMIFYNLDRKLKKLREKKQDLSQPSNWLVVASDIDIKKIIKKWKLPKVYLDFLKKYSPLNAEFNNLDFGRVSIYGAQNLIKKQEGYSYNNLLNKEIKEWNKNFIVIGDSFLNPFCIDISLEESPIYFAYHGIGVWNFNVAYNNFNEFIKSFI